MVRWTDRPHQERGAEGVDGEGARERLRARLREAGHGVFGVVAQRAEGAGGVDEEVEGAAGEVSRSGGQGLRIGGAHVRGEGEGAERFEGRAESALVAGDTNDGGVARS